VYDNPSATNQQLATFFNVSITLGDNATAAQKQASSDYNLQFGLLYSVYSWPNVVLPFIGGFIIDRLGVRKMMIAFTTLIAIGQLVVCVGLTLQKSGDALNSSNAWYVMYVGRTIFGFGGESLSVAQSTLVVQWFKGKELAFALGLNLALARLGSVFNDKVPDWIGLRPDNVPTAFWIGLFVCVASAGAAILCAIIDYRTEVRLAKENPEAGSAAASSADDVRITDARQFKLIFWLLCVSCVVIYCTILPFNNIAGNFFLSKYIAPGVPSTLITADQKAEADNLLTVVFLVSAMLSPVMGGFFDYFGKRAVVCLISPLIIVAVHVTLGQSSLYPTAPLVFLGLCYSIFAAALWPSIAYVVPDHLAGTAYGVVTAVQNLGLAVFPNCVSALQPTPLVCNNSWACVEWLFTAMGMVGVVCGVYINIIDARTGGVLNRSSKTKALDEEALKAPMLGGEPDAAFSPHTLNSPSSA
jgi:MFS family permease